MVPYLDDFTDSDIKLADRVDILLSSALLRLLLLLLLLLRFLLSRGSFLFRLLLLLLLNFLLLLSLLLFYLLALFLLLGSGSLSLRLLLALLLLLGSLQLGELLELRLGWRLGVRVREGHKELSLLDFFLDAGEVLEVVGPPENMSMLQFLVVADSGEVFQHWQEYDKIRRSYVSSH